jgi:aminopeptidase N
MREIRTFAAMIMRKRTILGIMLLICLIFYGFNSKLVAQEQLRDQSMQIAEMEKKGAARKLETMETEGNNLFSNASADFNIHHYRCEWKLDPGVRFIEGKVTASFIITSNTGSIIFDLVDSLKVDSVYFQGRQIGFERPGNNSLKVNFPLTLSVNSNESVTIYYRGVPPNISGFGTYINSMHSGIPVTWTLSEPYGSMEWWPCKNGLNDKTDSIDIVITTPLAYTSTTNGMLQKEVVINGERTSFWRHRYPIATYLVAIAATNYTVLTDTVQLGNAIMPIIQYAYPESAVTFKNAAGITARTIRLFHETFGDYPFIREKYGHTQFSWGGGMEHQTNSFMFNVSENLVVHEAAHQWFGDKITCGSWKDIWLNEGFAVFLTNYSIEKFYPESNLLSLVQSQLKSVVSQPGGAVYVDDTTNASRIFNSRLTYNKGGWLLRMLRWKLGDKVFFKGLRDYLNDPTLVYNYATSNDFKRNMENASGVDLTEFFADWLYGEGYPSYQLTWSAIGNGWVQTSLSQTTSHPSVAFFEMQVPVRFKNATRDTLIVINHERNQQITIQQLGFLPDSAFIDPFLKLISAKNSVAKTNSPTSIPNTVTVFPNPVQTQLTVYLKNFQPGNFSIVLYNTKGQLLWKKQIPNFSGSDFILISMAELPSGIYWLNIRDSDNMNIVKKIYK